MSKLQVLQERLKGQWDPILQTNEIVNDELTLEVASQDLLEICQFLKKDPDFRFDQLMDVCGVDYLQYGFSEWSTFDATGKTFSRGVDDQDYPSTWTKPRFAVVYHLLSIHHNQRIRLRTFALGEPPRVPSILKLWNSANWFEREAFDLYGILFDGHPDLRRILTDYGFIGHPFRKDFPLIGQVEMRYSAKDDRVIYEPVSIEPRTLVPKTISDDHRYAIDHEGESH